MKGPLGYGRYNDDHEHVGCPRAKSDMTPCVARDGAISIDCPERPVCVSCRANPADLLQALVREVTEPRAILDSRMMPDE